MKNRKAAHSRTFLKAISATLALLAQASLGLGQGLAVGKPQKEYLDLTNFPAQLAAAVEGMGRRMMVAERAQTTLNGTITDSKGTRNGAIVIQTPGKYSFREDGGRALVFDGTEGKTKSGQFTTDDLNAFESLLAHFPDAVNLQISNGGSLRRVGSHFRTDDGKSKSYSGPYWTLFAYTPASRPELKQASSLQQPMFIAIDESTGLVAEVRVAVKGPAGSVKVIQTQFGNWIRDGDQLFPGTIVRLEDGKQILSFRTQRASVGLAISSSEFVP